MRLLDSGLRAACDFLAAVDRTTRARQGLDVASRALDNSKPSGDQKAYQHYLSNYEEAREGSVRAAGEAEDAYATLRLLIPSVADQARRYLDFGITADAHPDTQKAERDRARQMVEDEVRQALRGGSAGDWAIAEPARGTRLWRRHRPALEQAAPPAGEG
jgi:hypothetical protein